MQRPDAQSTPQKKVRPLKSNDEFSSLHKRARPLEGVPLRVPSPAVPDGAARRHKLQIAGGGRVFSTMHAAESFNWTGAKRRKQPPPKSPSLTFNCIAMSRWKGHPTITINQAAQEITFGRQAAHARDLDMSYAITADRRCYEWEADHCTAHWVRRFQLSPMDHVAFKNAIIALSVPFKNTGSNLPPVGHLVEPRAPARSEPESTTITIALLDSWRSTHGPKSDGLKGTRLKAVLNSRGIYFSKPHYWIFQWGAAKICFGEQRGTAVKLINSSVTAIVDCLDEDTLLELRSFVRRFHRSDGAELLGEEQKPASKADEQKDDATEKERASDVDQSGESHGARDRAHGTEGPHRDPFVHNSGSSDVVVFRPSSPRSDPAPDSSPAFAPLAPGQFYSPQGRTAWGGSRPTSSSSPKPPITGKLFNAEPSKLDAEKAQSKQSKPNQFLRDFFSSPPRPLSKSGGLLASPRGANGSPKHQHDASKALASPARHQASPGAASPGAASPGAASPGASKAEARGEEQAHRSPGRRPRTTARAARAARADILVEDDLDAEEPSEESRDLLRANGYKPIAYRFHDGKAMHLSIEDIARLSPGIFLNDTIIWFFMKLFMDKLTASNPEMASEILLLDTFFYFAVRNGDSPPPWVARLPLTQKRVLIMPIHERAHWKVAAIIGLGAAVQQRAETQSSEVTELFKPAVVILDSLGGSVIHHTVRKVATVLGNCLRMQNLPVLNGSDYRSLRADVPKQTNLTDCGVYLLHYIEQILGHAREFLDQVAAAEGKVLGLGARFWKPDELPEKRRRFCETLKPLGNVEEGAASPRSGTSSSSKQGTPAETEAGDQEDDSIEIVGEERVVRKPRRSGGMSLG